MMFSFGSLFAGIGGLDLGLERAGMRCRWQVEIDEYCLRVLAKHWPDVRRYGDVRDCGAHNLEAVDLIAGGFPCQPHSVAGKRRGKEDDRDLWPEYLRLVAELRPRWVVGENVPGIVTTMLGEVLSDLEGEGYIAVALAVPAVAFGAPHQRERVFVVAYSGGARLAVGKAEGQGGGVCAVERSGWWDIEPGVGRVADGVPGRVDRVRALGNAVVPEVAEWIGRRILVGEGDGW